MELVLLLFSILPVQYLVARDVDYCFMDEPHPYLHFASKTPYRFTSDWKIQQRLLPNCKPVQIWMLARHGTRYPQGEAVERLGELPDIRDLIVYSHEKEGKGHLCDKDLEELKNWSPHPHMISKYASKLTREGWREGKELGKRLRAEYSVLLQVPPEQINSNNFVFRSIRGSRSESSMIALMEGLFDDSSAVKPVSTPKIDTLLRGDRHCHRWSAEKRGADVERDGFIHGSEYASLQRNVSQRLGFSVTPETIHNMQDMCRFETAWTPDRISPWCAIFSKEEWKVMEYIDDLQYYYSSGYGLEINKLIGCFPMENLVNYFSKIEKGESGENPRGIFYFTTSRILMDFLQSMNIAKDAQKLLANNFSNMTDRKWRVSSIAPFFANFVAVFHRCNVDSNAVNKVTFYLNENLIHYEGCQDGICDWAYLKKKMATNAIDCSRNCDDKIPEVSEVSEGTVSSPREHVDYYFVLVIPFLLVAFLGRNAIMNFVHRGIRYIVQKLAFKKVLKSNIQI